MIPARLGAERLPRKPLRLLGGRPLVVRVAENAAAAGVLTDVVVATDALEVAAVVTAAGFRVAMTGTHHESGTSRVAEVATQPAFAGYDVVVNVQGDEPFLPGAAIRGAVAEVLGGADVGTAAVPLEGDVEAPSLVKVVLDERGRALYFSRSPIPHNRAGMALRYWQHLGIYAYTPAALARWIALPPTVAEQAEKLEQLRALGHGMTFGVARLEVPALPGIDTPEDLARAEAHLAGRGDS